MCRLQHTLLYLPRKLWMFTNPGSRKLKFSLPFKYFCHIFVIFCYFISYPWKNSKLHTRMFLFSPLIILLSAADNSKSDNSKFCLSRKPFVLFGITATPLCKIHFSNIWAAVLPWWVPICIISGISKRSGMCRLRIC